MKPLYLFLITLALISNSISESPPSYYSNLLSSIRKDAIETILSALSKKIPATLTQMADSFAKFRDAFSLNEEESAYLIYRWIGEKFEFECNSDYSVHQFPNEVYKSKQGNYIGFTSLFNYIATYLNIKVVTISGKIKTFSDDIKKEAAKTVNGYWNAIYINNTYYLLDTVSGGGFCLSGYQKINRDFYFGTKPEFFIRIFFPNDDKWQLLNKKISLQTFESWPFVHDRFYLFGFDTVSPDTNFIDVSNGQKLIITFNKENIFMFVVKFQNYEGEFVRYEKNINISNGKVEITFDGEFTSKNYHSVLVFFKNDSTQKNFKSILIFKLK